jgi:hypothetical protein
MAGCGNLGCWIEEPVGHGTFGRCHCLDELGEENRQALKRKLVALGKLTQEMDKIAQDMELLRLAAVMFVEASALYHQCPHDSLVLRNYGEIRARFRDVIGMEEVGIFPTKLNG